MLTFVVVGVLLMECVLFLTVLWMHIDGVSWTVKLRLWVGLVHHESNLI
jgi:hypothetical protein